MFWILGALQISAGRLLLRWCFLHLHQLASCLPSDLCFFSVCTNILVSSGLRWFSRLLWEVKPVSVSSMDRMFCFVQLSIHPLIIVCVQTCCLRTSVLIWFWFWFLFWHGLGAVANTCHSLFTTLFVFHCMCLTLISLLQQHTGLCVYKQQTKRNKNYISKPSKSQSSENNIKHICELTLVLQGENVPVHVWLYQFENLQVSNIPVKAQIYCCTLQQSPHPAVHVLCEVFPW